MPWATKRRLFILLIIGSVAAAFLAVVLIATLYKSPTCGDSVQNQGETGIDCGGPCPYLCTADEQPPTVLFTQVLEHDGRTDVIASIENKNAGVAARNVPYTIALYGVDHAPVRELSGTIDLPPAATVPVYLPAVMTGSTVVASAFLTIDSAAPKWFALPVDPRIIPAVSNLQQSGMASSPRIDAILTNASASMLSNVHVIVFVKDAEGTVIAASQTVVPIIAAQGQATANFTWNSAFSTSTASIEVVPIIPLPQ